MARKDRKDRGLFSRPIPGTKGKLKWFVRLWHEGKERRFGSFDTKTAAREFYEKAKRQQREQQFFPEQYQRGGYELVQETIDRYLLTIKTKKDQRSQRYFAKWWTLRLAGKRLNHITPDDLEDARQALLTSSYPPRWYCSGKNCCSRCCRLAISEMIPHVSLPLRQNPFPLQLLNLALNQL